MEAISACTFDCSDACSLIVTRKEDGCLSIRGNPGHPFTRGFCCPKGAGYYNRFIAHPNRITRPLLKNKAGFEPVSWDRALDLCCRKIEACLGDPGQILHIHGYGSRGVFWAASSILFRRLGVSTTYGSLCDETGARACLKDFGSQQHNSPGDLENAARIINWGKDFERCSLHMTALVKQARSRGARVLSISPGGDSLARYSDELIRLRPGTDRFLAAAAIKILLENGSLKPELLARTANWPVFKALLGSWSIDDLLAAAEVTEDEALKLAGWYEQPEPAATLIGWGLQRYRLGGENVRFINALALLSGNLGRRGGGSYYNVSSTRNFASFTEKYGRYSRAFLLPDIGREILDADPPVKFIWVDCMNVVNQVPGCRTVDEAFKATDFVVAVEAFMNDTALCADLILPPALMLEREEVVGSNLHNFINYSAKVLEPRGEARSDFEIMTDLGRRLNPPVVLPPAEECLSLALDSAYLNITPEELKAAGFAQADHPHPAYENLIFDHPDGLYRFPESLNRESAGHPDYPLHLLSLVDKNYIHSQIPEEDQTGPPEVWASPQNSCLEQLNPDRPVFLATVSGRLPVRLKWSESLHPEAVIIRRGGWMKHGRSVNPIIEPMVTDMGHGTALYSQRARLEN